MTVHVACLCAVIIHSKHALSIQDFIERVKFTTVHSN